MPTYSFRNRVTGEVSEVLATLAEREAILSDPDIEQMPCSPALHSGRGMRKPDREFRDRLQQIKDINSRGFTKSTINTFG